jgi:tRNA A37 threonylcarbamoyladenosine dehydratase
MAMDKNEIPEWLSREVPLLGADGVRRLTQSSVLLFGAGGVGGYVAEGLVRAGIGRLTVVDHDVIAESNLNRQIITDTLNVGRPKADELCARAVRINPSLEARPLRLRADADNTQGIIDGAAPDFICDAIDTVTAKLLIIEEAKRRGIGVISCMGTGNKLDAAALRIGDISKTSVCPLARVMRRELRERGISGVDVLWSPEEPIRTGSRTPATVSYVPAVAGLLMAGYIIQKILNII